MRKGRDGKKNNYENSGPLTLSELEKVQNVPSIRNGTSSMFFKFLPLMTKSAEKKFTKSVEKIETITKIDTI